MLPKVVGGFNKLATIHRPPSRTAENLGCPQLDSAHPDVVGSGCRVGCPQPRLRMTSLDALRTAHTTTNPVPTSPGCSGLTTQETREWHRRGAYARRHVWRPLAQPPGRSGRPSVRRHVAGMTSCGLCVANGRAIRCGWRCYGRARPQSCASGWSWVPRKCGSPPPTTES